MHRVVRIWYDNIPADTLQVGRTPSAGVGQAASDVDPDADADQQRAVFDLPFVTVVVLARAGQQALTRCLEALARQTYPASRMEVIVVGDAHRAASLADVATLARLRPGLRLRYVVCPPPARVTAARNCGWRYARGELVGFTEDNATPGTEWVAAVANAYSAEVDVVGGQVVIPLPARPPVSVREAAAIVQTPWSAVNVFYRRALLDRMAGFDERLGPGGSGDLDLALAALKTGARFSVAERAVVVYAPPPARWLAGVRMQLGHLDEALLYKKHPDLYWRHVRQSPPVGGYAATIALLVALGTTLARRRRLAVPAAALWLGMTLADCGRAAHGTSDRPRDLADLFLTTMLAPPVTVACRLVGAVRHRVWFV
jgi:Glycosyl transferase family 2